MSKKLLGSIELNRIYQRDCIEGMRMIPDGSISTVIADPPYGMNYRSNYRKQKFDAIQNDNVIATDWLAESYRTLKDGGAIYCYTRWDVYPEWHSALVKAGFKIKNVVIWHKRGGGLGDLKGAYMFNHEFIIYAVKGRHVLNGKRTADVWEVAKDASTSYEHPTQKPVRLAEMIIEKSSVPNDVVLIPFCGSGSECVAASHLGRDFVSFELEPKYIEIANKRIDMVGVIK